MSVFRGKHRIPDYRISSHCQCWMCGDFDICRTLHELLDPGSSQFQLMLALHSFRWSSRMLEIYCCLLVPLDTLETYLNFSFLRFYMQIPVGSSGNSVSEKKLKDVIKCLRCIEKFCLSLFFFNINNKCGTVGKDGQRQSSGELVKKRIYRICDDIYLDFDSTSIYDKHQECPQCLSCLEVACF